MVFSFSKVVLSLAAAGLLLSAGCATSSSSTYSRPIRTGDPIADGHAAIAQGPARDKVLWQYRTALAALRKGQKDEAKRLLDDALLTIGNIYDKDKSAKKARGYFNEEAKKTFIGEPYERVMAYFYRGIIYWMDGEPDNARACFRSAQLVDGDPEKKDYASDYVLLDYLDGLASAKLSGDGSDALKRAQAVCKFGTLPPYDPKANALVFLEFGRGPTKYATGEYAQELRIKPGHSPHAAGLLKIGNLTVKMNPYDDLSYQATTRGGRVMDHILANKAVFKSSTDAASTAALLSGMVVAGGTKHTEAGLGLMAAGLIGKIISASTTPEADTRAWDDLPQFISFVALPLPAGQHQATLEFVDSAGRPTLTKTFTINVADLSRDTVLFLSDRS